MQSATVSPIVCVCDLRFISIRFHAYIASIHGEVGDIEYTEVKCKMERRLRFGREEMLLLLLFVSVITIVIVARTIMVLFRYQ